jgi:magnesium-transporting ATPase (P-type)
MMITGDSKDTAVAIAREVGECLRMAPHDCVTMYYICNSNIPQDFL